VWVHRVPDEIFAADISAERDGPRKGNRWGGDGDSCRDGREKVGRLRSYIGWGSGGGFGGGHEMKTFEERDLEAKYGTGPVVWLIRGPGLCLSDVRPTSGDTHPPCVQSLHYLRLAPGLVGKSGNLRNAPRPQRGGGEDSIHCSISRDVGVSISRDSPGGQGEW